jgi:hypothetical protein
VTLRTLLSPNSPRGRTWNCGGIGFGLAGCPAAFGAVFGATLIQTVKTGLVFTGVNLYL